MPMYTGQGDNTEWLLNELTYLATPSGLKEQFYLSVKEKIPQGMIRLLLTPYKLLFKYLLDSLQLSEFN